MAAATPKKEPKAALPIRMMKAELCKVKSANKTVDRPHRIVWTDMVLDPWRKQAGLVPALARE